VGGRLKRTSHSTPIREACGLPRSSTAMQGEYSFLATQSTSGRVCTQPRKRATVAAP
jgi:hypothetical protein